MSAREDLIWLSPLNMNLFDKAGSQDKVFVRECQAWGGMSDKVFILGRQAAEKVLIGMYSQFWTTPQVEA